MAIASSGLLAVEGGHRDGEFVVNPVRQALGRVIECRHGAQADPDEQGKVREQERGLTVKPAHVPPGDRVQVHEPILVR